MKVEPIFTECLPAQSIAKADDKMKSVTRISAKLNGYFEFTYSLIKLMLF